MRKLYFASSLILSSSAIGAMQQPERIKTKEEFIQFFDQFCQRSEIRCVPELTQGPVVGFQYAGDGYQAYFWLSWNEWSKFEEKYAERWKPIRATATIVSHPSGNGVHILSNVITPPISRLDELETKKNHIQMLQSFCAGAFATCAFAIGKMGGYWPGLVLTMTCTASGHYCAVRTTEEIEKIDAELAIIKSPGGFNTSSSGGAGESISGPSGPAPNFPGTPLPAGTVTIIDLPHEYIP